MKMVLRLHLTLLLALLSAQSVSEDNRSDYDLDDDGLIEINDLADLDEIRNDLSGTSLYGESTGCPVEGCVGFELTTDLNFDTNGDGLMNSSDAYWNNGAGWDPIGESGATFTAEFNGNNHQILNLHINRPEESDVGLFGQVSNATLQKFHIVGELTNVAGNQHVGILAGYTLGSTIYETSTRGTVSATNMAGGLVGRTSNSNIELGFSVCTVNGGNNTGGLTGLTYGGEVKGSFAVCEVSGTNNVGGLFGTVDYDTQILATFTTGTVTGTGVVGGYAGMGGDVYVEASFTASKVNGIDPTRTGRITGGTFSLFIFRFHVIYDIAEAPTTYGVTNGITIGRSGGQRLKRMQCPTNAGYDGCNTSGYLLEQWRTFLPNYGYTNAEAEVVPYWDFGNAGQLPGININGIVYRDSDGDGSLDQDDDHPNDHDLDGIPDIEDGVPTDPTETVDSDDDGVGDNTDHFPNDPEETVDSDGDGVGDNGDPFPEDPSEWADSDGDGVGDNADVFPADPNETVDSDGDGVGDNGDAFPNNPGETKDTDGDGIGNNEDTDDDDDGVPDTEDLFPEDATGSTEADDIDTDNDNLIEITSLEDLNDIRNSPDGKALYGVTAGCPTGCQGFELMSDLDFDTNDDGLMDENDSFWNGGEGWQPLSYGPAVFEGNGHQIKNLYINRPDTYDVGLFRTLSNGTEIRNLGLSGSLMSITGRSYVGAIAGASYNAGLISRCFATGNIFAVESSAGGLVGHLHNADFIVRNSFFTGTVNAGTTIAAGLISQSNGIPIKLENSFAVATVTATSEMAGLIYNFDSIPITASYWASDVSGIEGGSESTNFGATLTQLQCPTAASNNYCVSGLVLYADWAGQSADDPVWDFGTSTQLPGLIMGGRVYRDSDGDGSLDEDDIHPFDHDNDGVSDAKDAFPLDETESLDTDADGVGNNADTDDDGDGLSDADEGSADSNGNRIPDDLDPYNSTSILIANGAYVLRTVENLNLSLGDVAFAAGNASALVIAEDINGHFEDVLAEDNHYFFGSGIYDFQISGFSMGSSVAVSIYLPEPLPANAVFLRYVNDHGWQLFIGNTANQLKSAAAVGGVCPDTESPSYVNGLLEGNDCVLIILEDGGPNDADGLADGLIEYLGAAAIVSIPEPSITLHLNPLSVESFSNGDGEQVVLSFSLNSDSDDGEIEGLSLASRGALNEFSEIGAVRVYLDANNNGLAEESEHLGQGNFAADNASLDIQFDSILPLGIGSTTFLVTYQF